LAENRKLETLNVLHLLEALILADEVTVSTFESESSQETSNLAIEALRPLADTVAPLAVRTGLHSSWESQLDIARDTATEIFDRRLLTFNPDDDSKLSQGIDVAAARPGGVVEPTAPFWESISQNKTTTEQIRSRAAGEVHLHRTDGLFLFGVAHHDEFCEQVLRSYGRYGPWPEAHWNRLHVLFRAIFNQRIADRIDGAIYSPPPVRAELLGRVNSLSLQRFREALEDLAISASRERNRSFLSDYAGGFKVPIPLLGLAVLPHGGESPSRFLDRLAFVRTEASDLRDQLRRLNSLYMTGNKDDAFREIEKECRAIKRGVSERLGLGNTRSLPLATVDPGVMLSEQGLAGVPDAVSVAKLTDWVASIAVRRRKRVKFLANMLARAAEEPRAQNAFLWGGDNPETRLFPPRPKARSSRDALWGLRNDLEALKEDLRILSIPTRLEEYDKCLDTFGADPPMAFVAARKIVEAILRDLYRTEFGEPSRDITPVKQAMKLQYDSGVVPETLASAMNTVIQHGNIGAHGAHSKKRRKVLKPAEVEFLFKGVFSDVLAIASWYFRRGQSDP
jgi:hypothetical protein